MKFWQRMAKQFLKLRKQLQKRYKAVIALAAVVVFMTTYALILPAVTEDSETAAKDPAMSVGTTSVAETNATGDGGTGDVTEGSVDQQKAEEEKKEEPAAEQTAATENENAEAADLIAEDTTLTDRNEEGRYTISTDVTADAKLKKDTALTTSEISKDKDETKDTYQAYLDKAQTALQAQNVTVADAHFYDISLMSGSEKEEPQAAVKTTIQFDDPIELKDGQDIQIAHIDENGNLTILDKTAANVETTKTAAENQIGSVSFNANQFSVYGVIATSPKQSDSEKNEEKEQKKDDAESTESAAESDAENVKGVSGERTIKAGNAMIQVSYGEDAGLPKGADLNARELSDDEKTQYQDGVKEALGNIEIVNEHFFDIYFTYEGKKIEPKAKVNVTITLSGDARLMAGNDVKIVHFADGKDRPDVLDSDVTGGRIKESDEQTKSAAKDNFLQNSLSRLAPKRSKDQDTDSVVTFKTNSFSIYGVVGTKTEGKATEVRRKYTFKNDDGSAYQFNLDDNPDRDKSSTADNQIVKNGDRLRFVGIPTPIKDENQGKQFDGWEVTEAGTSGLTEGTILTLPMEVTGITGSDNQYVTLTAHFEDEINVIFHDEENTVFEVQKVKKGNSLDISDITTDGTGDVTLAGWTTTKTLRSADKVSNTSASIKYTNNIPASDTTGNIELWPVFKSAYWLQFDSNDSDTGTATVTNPVRYAAGVPTVKPADPQRKGYTFEGWYKEPSCKNEFTFGLALTGNITVYAKWKSAATTYTVIVWKQNINDDKDLSEDQKNYDYETSFQYNSTTDATVNATYVANAIQQSINEYTLQDGKENAFKGFTLKRYDPEGITVKSDGSSIINAYYDRDLITINFTYSAGYQYVYTAITENTGTQYGLVNGNYVELSYSRNGNNYTGQPFGWSYDDGGPYEYNWHAYKDTRYTRSRQYVPTHTDTMTGLYGQPLSKYYGGGSDPWPNGYWQDSRTSGTNSVYLEYLGAFIPSEQLGLTYATTINLVDVGGSGRTFHFIKQNLDGTYPNTDSAIGHSDNGSNNWAPDQHFEGFTYDQYRIGGSSNWRNTSDISGSISLTSLDTDVYVRYKRLSYDIVFHNGTGDNSTVKTDTEKYEAPLSNSICPDASSLTYPGNTADAEHYTFVGWFADPELTTYVSFGTDLTDQQQDDLQNQYPSIKYFTTYKKMPANNLAVYAGWKKNSYHVRLNVNEGKLRDGQEAEFNVEYGELIDNAINDGISRDGHEFQGWYEENPDGTINLDKPWNFSTVVDRDVNLIARWKSNATIRIKYDPVDKSDSRKPLSGTIDGKPATVEDSIVYSDGSHATLAAAPTPPNGYHFIGWAFKNETYAPHYRFAVNAADAETTEDSNVRTITLEARYEELDTTFIRYHYNVENVTEGTQKLSDINDQDNIQRDLTLNATVTLSNGSGFTRKGYVLTGWNTNPSGGTDGHWDLADTVGVNDVKGNDLYAEWAPVYVTVRFTKKGEQTDGSAKTALAGAVFTLANGSEIKTVTSGSDGSVLFAGSNAVQAPATENGTITLRETSAPDGYDIASGTPWIISYDESNARKADDGKYYVDGTIKNGDTTLTEITDPILKTDIKVIKEDQEGNKLTGASFTLKIKGKDGAANTAAKATSGLDEDGKFTIKSESGVEIKGLPVGSYVLTETNAPDGYIINTSAVEFTVTKEEVKVAEGTNDTIATADSNTLTVKNTPGQALPNTGGHGILPFVLGGMFLISAAGVLYIISKKRSSIG